MAGPLKCKAITEAMGKQARPTHTLGKIDYPSGTESCNMQTSLDN